MKTITKQKIVPHLWFDKEAVEAAEFYTSVFENSKIRHKSVIKNTPSGDCDIVSFFLFGQEFMAISAGPIFKFNPSVSLFITCKTQSEVDEYWNKLSKGGKALMPLGKYPFSERYGWIQDKYGLSWQIFYSKFNVEHKIKPSLMFVGKKKAGRAKEAIKFWSSIFRKSKTGNFFKYEKGDSPYGDKPGTIKYGEFELEGYGFVAMDSAYEHGFDFNEAISFIVKCKNQKEIDYYWNLSADPKSEQCGWLKDKFGVSWQIAPIAMDKMMATKDKKKLDNLTRAFLKMKKFDIKKLEKAYKEG